MPLSPLPPSPSLLSKFCECTFANAICLLLLLKAMTVLITLQNARDSGGAAIAVFTARDHFPAATSHRTVIQGIAFQLDECLKRYAAIM